MGNAAEAKGMNTSPVIEDQLREGHGKLVRFKSSDISKARDLMSNFIGLQGLRVNNSDAFKFSSSAQQFSSADLNLIEYGTNVTVELEELTDYYTVILPVAGTVKLRLGDKLMTSDTDNAIIVSPTASANLEISSDCRKWLVRIRRSSLEQQLAKILGRNITKPVIFDCSMVAHSGPGSSWWRTITYLKQEQGCADSLYSHKAFQAQIEQILISGLLYSQKHNYTQDIETKQVPVLPDFVKRAKTFINQYVQEPITSEDIVMASAVPRRTLYDGFKRFMGTAPMTYLNNVRMVGARDDLLKGATNKTITSVALKWGFNHLSRFSVNYRRRFGESPSETLKHNAASLN